MSLNSESQGDTTIFCNGCSMSLPSTWTTKKATEQISFCPLCQKVYCLSCDVFVHETLASCPTCPN